MTIRHAHPHGKEHVAANLVRDAAYRAFTAPGRRLSSTEIAVDPRTLDEEPYVARIGPCEELATLLADARTFGVPSTDLDLIRELATVGSPGRVAARAMPSRPAPSATTVTAPRPASAESPPPRASRSPASAIQPGEPADGALDGTDGRVLRRGVPFEEPLDGEGA